MNKIVRIIKKNITKFVLTIAVVTIGTTVVGAIPTYAADAIVWDGEDGMTICSNSWWTTCTSFSKPKTSTKSTQHYDLSGVDTLTMKFRLKANSSSVWTHPITGSMTLYDKNGKTIATFTKSRPSKDSSGRDYGAKWTDYYIREVNISDLKQTYDFSDVYADATISIQAIDHDGNGKINTTYHQGCMAYSLIATKVSPKTPILNSNLPQQKKQSPALLSPVVCFMQIDRKTEAEILLPA